MAGTSGDEVKDLGRAPSKCVGPEYKSSDEKPTATVSTEIPHDNVHILPQTSQLISLLTYVYVHSPTVRLNERMLIMAALSQYDP